MNNLSTERFEGVFIMENLTRAPKAGNYFVHSFPFHFFKSLNVKKQDKKKNKKWDYFCQIKTNLLYLRILQTKNRFKSMRGAMRLRCWKL